MSGLAVLLQTLLEGTSRPLAVFVLVSYLPLLVVLYFYRKDVRRSQAQWQEVIVLLREVRALLTAWSA